MRTLIMITLFLISYAGKTQDVFSNKTNMALEKVVKDFPNRFRNIRGELIVQHPQTAEYKSTIQVPGSSSCIVTKYLASNDEAYSWSCTITEGKDFGQAKIKFKEIFEQIENTIIKIEGEKPFIVTGQYRTPVEERKLTKISFDLLPAVGDMKKLKIELILQDIGNNWKVNLNVFENTLKEEQYTASN